MFRVEKIEYTHKNIRMPSALLNRMATLAQAKDISLNQLIIQCCEYAMDNLETDENNE